MLRAHLLEGVGFSRIAVLDAVVLTPWLSEPRSSTWHVQGYAEAYEAMPDHLFEAFFSAKGDKLFYRMGRGVMQVPLTVTGDRMTLGTPTMYVEFPFADFQGRSYKLGHDDRLLVKLLPSTTPQSEIRVMTGTR